MLASEDSLRSLDGQSLIYLLQARMDWLCSWIYKKKEVIQAYKPIDSQQINKAYPKTGGHASLAKVTPSATVQSIKRESQRMRPIKQFVLPNSQSGYISIKELKTNNGNSVLRKIQKSNYEEEYNKCKSKQVKWTDPDFPQELTETVRKWKRITEIIPGATFMKYPIDPNDIIQGQLNDCYWMSAVASLAERDYRIKNLFGSLELNPYGIYMCKLTYNGIYQEVVVDDYFPVDEHDQLVYARPYSDTDFWALVLEKCWAKLYNSYERMNWGYNPESLFALTGAPVKEFVCQRFLSQSEDDNKLFGYMMEHQSKNHLITCAILKRKDVYDKIDLQVGHAYSLGVFQIKYNGSPLRLIQVRNPLGNTGVVGPNEQLLEQPNLPYNAKDNFWKKISEQQRNKLQYWMIQKPGDGIFYVQWSKFLVLFDRIAFCSIDDNSNYLYETKEFMNGEAQFISLQIDDPTQFSLMIAQPDKRRREIKDKDIRYAGISVLVARVTYNYANQRILEYIYAKSYTPTISTNYFPVSLNLKKGGSYTIRISVVNPMQPKTSITIGFYSPDDFAVKYLKDVDDNEFLYRTLLQRANNDSDPNNNKNKKDLPNAKGWCCIENISGSDLSYIAYHISAASEHDKYRIKVDESQNSSRLYFLGHQYGKASFQQTISKGQEVLFVYTYEYQLPDPELNPSLKDQRELPKPIFQPI